MNVHTNIDQLADAPPVDGSIHAPPGPHNLEAEQALLGALLVNNDVYTSIAAFLGPEHFWEPLHARIYATACELIERGHRVNPVTVQHYFVDDEGLRQLGGPAAYMATLAAACPAIVLAPDYARIIHELASRRRMLDVAEHLRDRASASDVDRLDDIISETLDMIANGSGMSDRLKRTRAGFGETAVSVIDRVNQAYMDAGEGKPANLTAVTTGSAALDRKIIGWRRKHFHVMAGRPGMGKSTTAMSLLLRTARKGGGVLVFSLEMSKEALVERCLSDLSYRHDRPIPYERISRNDLEASDIERLVEAETAYHALPIVIEEKAGLSVPQMRVITQNVAQRMAEKGQRLDVVLVDHLGKVKASGNYKGNKVAETGEVSGALAEMAKDLDVAVVMLAQLSRQVEGRDDKRPTLADLRWAGEIEQDVDVALMLYREAYYLDRRRDGTATEKLERDERMAQVRYQIEVEVAKNRGGAPGTVEMWTDIGCAAVRDLAPAGLMQERMGL